MSGRPASIIVRDCKQVILAAQKTGAPKVEFRIGAVPAIVHLSPEDEPIEVAADCNNSFDKIMRDK